MAGRAESGRAPHPVAAQGAVLSLTRRDIRSRYKQSVLGIAWALLQPLAMTMVFTVVMSHIAKIDTGKIPAPIFVYIAMLPWTFFKAG